MADRRYVGKMLLAVAATWAAASPATGQPAGPTHREAVVVGEGEGGVVATPTTLLGRFGVPVAKRLLFAEDRADRLRGIERLGASGTDEAIEALVNAMEVGTALGRDPEARLLAVRSLAPFAHRPGVRSLLTRELSDPGKGKSAAVTSLGDLLRDSAALALARSAHHQARGDDEALAALMVAVRQGGLPAEAASRALMAFPPPSIEGILDGFSKSGRVGSTPAVKPGGEAAADKKKASPSKPGKKPTAGAPKNAPPPSAAPRKALAPPVIELLGDIGDLRATARLRAELKRKDQAGQIAAAIALAKLGDVTPAELARTWIKRPDARLQTSATEVLVRLATPDAPRAIATLLSSDATRARGVRFALDAPTPALAQALEQALPKLAAEQRPACVEALGRAGGAAATAKLLALTADPALRTPAAFALATSPGDEATAALSTALAGPADKDDGSTRRLFARAGTVRALTLGEPPDGLVATLERMLGSKRPEDRGAAAFGLVAMGELDVADVIAKADEAAIRGAAAGSIAQGADALESWVALLAPRDEETTLASAAGVALLSDEALSSLPTSWLLREAERGGALSPLASRALAIRDDEPLRPQITRLLEGTDPMVRAHVALGLGQSHEPDAVSLLANAYRFEPDAAVRRAVVRGLSARSEVQRLQPLRWARDLDPDPAVRALAGSALAGRRLDEVAAMTGRHVGWIELVPNGPSASPMSSGRGALVVRGDGVGIPVVSSADGVILVPGLGFGAGSVRLAPAPPPGDATPP